jgi:quinoprotein glucose dehydrogenase
VPGFGQHGRSISRAGWPPAGRSVDGLTPLQTSNPGRVFEDLIIISLPAQAAGYDSNPGDVHAYDVRTARCVGVPFTARERRTGADTWPKRRARHAWRRATTGAS